MPLFELETSRRGRLRVFARAQLPFILGAVFVYLAILIGSPASLGSPLVVSAAVVITLASVAAAAVPWERFAPGWLIVVAVLDMIAVAFLRAELLTVIPSASMLAIFPILWLAYGFPPFAFVVAVGGAAFITTFTFVYRGALPRSPLDWVNVVTLPGLILAIAVVVHIAARTLRRSSARLRSAQETREAALARTVDNELVLRSVLDTVNSAVVLYDDAGDLVLANATADRFAASMGFRLDRPPYAGDAVLAADRATPVSYDEQIIPRALRGERIDGELEWVGPSDQQMAIIAASDRIRRPDGSLLGTVIAAYDVTDLADAVEVREDFLRTVSHELRTPLTSITGYVDLIADRLGETDAAVARHIAAVERNVQSLTERVNELLAASASDGPLSRRSARLGSLVGSAVAAVGLQAELHGSTIEQAGSADHEGGGAGEEVDLDPIRVRQALHEILVNAVKFSPAGSTIVVRHGIADGSAFIAVTDPGIGLTRAEQGRMFDPFYRTAYARSNAIQGFGIGLTVVKTAALAHEGRVIVDTAPGSGTTMTLSIPQPGRLAGGRSD